MADIVRQKTLKVYATEDGKEPYTEWLENLKDYTIRSRIIRRIERLKQGNYGDCKSVGDGVLELRFFFGSGYRVYFGESANDLVILLCGGDKDSQDKDIEKAKKYWEAYQEEQHEQETEKP
ncbi:MULTISPECIES: type II toxin-antitoxin system RelE/ParE family toxin [Nostoc]|uniref:Type II toxin-antitoxin system RelE/ParE family toxin n=1 Tax=Nostoc spongiaeforme FACHB-130 TaxID=1357510 RepID=A0ABR8G3D5_9NOSO|nr:MULTISPECIES: type II toxin-antitoxin system RelE/ParE family toxin [Nostoc]MBD2496514.1 type II toxin-antitoxin system RelE/ParE family toxin [Nostoc sp. FACHB-280]MBD2597684.1 type II toxin-antitoxin system RelE/ParE family toxin [Nostoc spongiaeforme FACHB-130]